MRPPKVGEDDFYILPQLEIITSVKDKSMRWIRDVKDLKELYSYDFLCIVAEPGNGKSRLLKEIVLKASKNNQAALYLDLKKCKDSTIAEKIDAIKKRKPASLKNNNEINAAKDFFFSENFVSSSAPIICLDALDEVKNEELYEYLDKIKDFSAEYSGYKIVLSCRDYIYSKYESLMSGMNPTLIEVKPFSGYLIKQYMVHYGISESDALAVIKDYYRGFELGVIKSPRILEIFTSIAQKEGIIATHKKSKAELLEQFIYGKLDIEDKKTNKDKKQLVKRILEKLALIMEMNQHSEIKHDDFLTFIDDVDSNLLNQIGIDYLYKHSILVPSSDGEGMQFENVEFQEYLAAKEISRLGRADQVLFDLVVEKRLGELIPSWANTMKYFFELVPKVQPLVVDFIYRNNKYHNADLLEQILISDSNYHKNTAESERSEIFAKVFDLFQTNSWPLHRLYYQLSQYYSSIHEEKIKIFLLSEDEIQKSNALILLNVLFLDNKIHLNDFYKNTLMLMLATGNLSDDLKNHTIHALGRFKDFEIIKDTYKYFEFASEHTLGGFLRVATEIDANNIYTIELLLKHTIKGDLRNHGTVSLDEVSSLAGIKYYLQKFLDDEELGSKFINYAPDAFVIDQMVENITKVYSDEVNEILKKIIFGLPCYHGKSVFIQKIFDLLNNNVRDLLNELVDDLLKSGTYVENWYAINSILAPLINDKNVLSFLERMKEIPDSRASVSRLLTDFFLVSSEPESQKVARMTESLFEEEFKITRDNLSLRKEYQSEADKKRYEEFLKKIQPNPPKIVRDVFHFYTNCRTFLQPFMSDKDRERMKELIEEIVLVFDFSNAGIKYTDKSVGRFTFSNTIQIFEDAIPHFREFNIDLNKHRTKLLEFLPFSFGYNNNKVEILELLGDLNETEVDNLVKFYNTPRPDDVIEHNIERFFDYCDRFKILPALPILKSVVEDKAAKSYSRVRALRIIHTLKPDVDFYQKVFLENEFSSIEVEKELTFIANGFLITIESHYKLYAVKWRLKSLLDFPIETDLKPESDRFLLRDFMVGNIDLRGALNTINDPNYTSIFFDFLKSAVDLYNSNDKYRAYANFIWEVVFVFVDNLKSHRDYLPYEMLEKTIRDYKTFNGFKHLQNRLFNVRINYLQVLSKPLTLTECIKEYNRLKSQQYLSVATAKDFYFIINEIIEKDIRSWTEQEGAYKFITKFSREEDLIQKTIKTQFENGLLRRGFRENEVRIRREEQLLDDKRTDFVISFGFIGQVLIELKRSNNPEVLDHTYATKLLQYVNGTKSDFGVFLIFQTNEEKPWEMIKEKVIKIYDQHFEKIKVVGMDCTKTN